MRSTSTTTFVALALCVGACNDATSEGIADLSGKPSFAVALSDYESAGVALIDGDGKVLSKKYISSGTELPGLSSALHGDIGLPTQPCEEGVLTVIARYGGDYVLQVDLDNGKVLHQVATQGKSGGAAYSGNPQDILCFSDGTALVSRLEPSLDPKASGFDKGDDLVRINLDKEKLVSRIDLSKLRGKAIGYDADGNEEQQVAYARPGSLVRIGHYALVGLSRLTASFTAAEGLLGIVNLDNDKVSGFELGNLRNCGSLSPVAGRDDAVIVSCSGYPFGDRKSAGLLLVSLSGEGKATIEHTFQASSKLPIIYAYAVSLGGTRALAVATGDFTAMPSTPDVAYVVDLESGESDELFTSSMAGEIGAGAFRLDTGLLLVPDAAEGVRLFEVSDSAVKDRKILPLDPSLPARAIAPLVAL